MMLSAKKISPEYILYLCTTALFFVTPLSSSLKSIFLSLTVAIIILTPRFRQELSNLLANKYFLSVILLVMLAAIGCVWSPAIQAEKFLVFEKWSKLLYLPCLVVALKNPKHQQMAINAFILAMVITCCCSLYLKIAGIHGGGKMEVDGVFRNHIMTGIMVAFAAYLAGIAFLRSKKLPRVLYLLTFLLTTAHIFFINESRTGYAIYLLLFILLVIQYASWRQALLAVLAICVIFAISFYVNNQCKERVELAYQQLHNYSQDKNTSLGFRIQFHDFATKIFQEKPLIGQGTGSFTYKFRVEDPVPAWTHDENHSGRLLEPHGQYWLVAAEFGIIGLLALLFFYLELAYRTYNLDKMRPIAIALFIMLIFGNLSDSLLFYSGSGYFFILFFALAFSEQANVTQVISSLHKSINKKHVQIQNTANS